MSIDIGKADLNRFGKFMTSGGSNISTIVTLKMDLLSKLVYYGQDARRFIQMGNAAGHNSSGVLSEAVSVELFRRSIGISNVQIEKELQYQGYGPIVDFAASVWNGPSIGVQVTQAFDYYGGPLTAQKATELVEHKLADLLHSRGTVLNAHFEKQILNIMVKNEIDANVVQRVTDKIFSEYKYLSTMVMICTVNDDRIYSSNTQYLEAAWRMISRIGELQMDRIPAASIKIRG